MRPSQDRVGTILYLCASVVASVPGLLALPQRAAPQARAGALIFAVDPTQSAVHWTLGTTLHTVHGTFALKSGNLQLDPSTGTAGGAVIADATTGKSGNDGRDRKMHKDVLESTRFGEVIFRPDSIAGKLEMQGDSAVQVHGIFLLHGSEHELTVPAQVNLSGDHWSGSAKFSIPFIEWGLKNPSNLLLKVDHSVSIELELKGTIQAPGP